MLLLLPLFYSAVNLLTVRPKSLPPLRCDVAAEGLGPPSASAEAVPGAAPSRKGAPSGHGPLQPRLCQGQRLGRSDRCLGFGPFALPSLTDFPLKRPSALSSGTCTWKAASVFLLCRGVGGPPQAGE